MKPMTTLLLTGMLAVTVLGESSWACNTRCRPVGGYIQATPQVIVRPPLAPQPRPVQPPPNFRPAFNGLKNNDTVINDLPADAKLAIWAAAAKVRSDSATRQPVRTPR